MCLLLHHVLCRVFLAKHQITQVTQLPTAQIWCPVTSVFFPKLKSPLKGKRFQTIDQIQENTTGQLMSIPTKDFAECFEQWKRCWENWVRSQGAYFERDLGVIDLCAMFLVSCSINVSIFHSTWLNSFWTDIPDNKKIYFILHFLNN